MLRLMQAWAKPGDYAQARANLMRAVKEAFDAAGIDLESLWVW